MPSAEKVWIFPTNLLQNQGDKCGKVFIGAINWNRRTIFDTHNDRMCGSIVLNQNQISQMKDGMLGKGSEPVHA